MVNIFGSHGMVTWLCVPLCTSLDVCVCEQQVVPLLNQPYCVESAHRALWAVNNMVSQPRDLDRAGRGVKTPARKRKCLPQGSEILNQRTGEEREAGGSDRPVPHAERLDGRPVIECRCVWSSTFQAKQANVALGGTAAAATQMHVFEQKCTYMEKKLMWQDLFKSYIANIWNTEITFV